ncbi:MAG TPA: efflux RND transporter periplasmic adaptor subunit [Acidobacteriaceae bacterium]|jgi:RND family efflux transporter MFP subunit|nr:efflux RND transporter periplasmic adaptor subunit [Acidobacteriaceae bacterium]
MKFSRHSILFFSVLAFPAMWAFSGCDRSARANAHADASANALDASSIPVVDTALVTSHALNVTTPLPGELQPYEVVAVYPKVTGFVQWIGVDRGSKVHQGELLAQLVAPELTSQRVEAQAKLQSAESRRVEAEAKTAADEATYQRLKAAAATPGVISDNELQIAQQTAVADRARQLALSQAVDAARATLKSVEEIAGYLRIVAPFDGVVTSRNVHPGALVGPGGGGGSQIPMLNISQVSRLRLVVAVPEMSVATISPGANVAFNVATYPNETFHGKVARLAQSVDVKTRTMPVELDVDNSSGRLAPGMYPQVMWPERHDQPTLFVPSSSVVRSMEETFVIRIRNKETEWVKVKTGAASGEEVEVFGNLDAGQEVALRGTEELRSNTRVTPKLDNSPATRQNQP